MAESTKSPAPSVRRPFPWKGSPRDLPRARNGGLLFDKFFDRWTAEWQIEAEGKADWLKDLFAPFPERVTNPKVRDYPIFGSEACPTRAAARLEDLARATRGQSFDLATQWRLAIGLGRPNPVENGLTWHHTLGVPYLPGSGLKGLMRSWVREWAEDADPALTTLLLGPPPPRSAEKRPATARAGALIVFDALPTAPVQPVMDVMTPHAQPYYQCATGDVAPGDWLAPNPIPFLTVPEGTTFRFAIGLRSRASLKQPGEDTAAVTAEEAVAVGVQWLGDALQTLGAGAKTAVGYGGFDPPER